MLPRILPLLLLLLAGAAACTPKFERPNLTVVGVEMQGGNFLQQNFLVKFQNSEPQ